MSGRRTWSDIRRPSSAALEEGFSAAIETGLWLPALRCEAGLTQEQLAERLGVTQSWVSQIETQTDVRLSTLTAYIAALGGQLRLAAAFPNGRDVDLRHTPLPQTDVTAAR